MGRLTLLLSSLLLLVLVTMACRSDDDSPNRVLPTLTAEEHAEVRFDPFYPLIDAERSELSICVTGEGGYVSDTDDLARVQTALEDGLARHEGLPVEYDSRSVTEGCPPTRVPIGELVGNPSSFSSVVEASSNHFMFIYLLPVTTYNEMFPSQERYALGSAESVCAGDECERVTIGLFLPSNADASDIEQALLEALLLVPRPTPRFTLDDVRLTPGFELSDSLSTPMP